MKIPDSVVNRREPLEEILKRGPLRQWEVVRRLSEETGCVEASARRTLLWAERLGWITRQRCRGMTMAGVVITLVADTEEDA
jgi:hypothetical protein